MKILSFQKCEDEYTMCQKIVEKLKKILADGARGGHGEGDLQEPQQHGSQPLQEGHHLVQGKH